MSILFEVPKSPFARVLRLGLAAACLGALVTVITPAASRAETVAIKLATLVPDGSIWHKVLLDMGDEWNRDTQGRVTLKMYPGGALGDEPDLLRKMRIGQIHASALTVKGLAEIDDAFATFTVPMMFDSYDELNHVLKKMEPDLKKRLEAKGFVLLNWGHAGWVYFFSKQPIKSLAEFKKLKLWVWAGDDEMNQLWKANGFHAVPLAATDIVTGLQTGMVDVLPSVPLGALGLQWFRTTPYMMDIGFAPLVGGLVITSKTWARISEADRAKVQAACTKAEKRLETMIPDQDRVAVAEMQKRGLKVLTLDAARAAEFRAETESFAGKMRGTIVPAEALDFALRERNAFRQQKPKR
jgi:TRAP-type C4-dicarboxylate transport system substrate-binding protein